MLPVFAEAFEKYNTGATSYEILSANSDPLDVVVILRWDTIENAKAFFDHPRIPMLMEEAGVTEFPVEIVYLEPLTSGDLESRRSAAL